MSLISPADVTVPVTVQGRTSLDQARAFAIIVPMDLSLVFKGWGGIFPGVRGANNQTGSWDHVGASRNPDMSDGTTAVETLTEYTAPHSFAYELVAFTNILGRLAAGVRGEWTFTPDGARTVIRWTYEFMPRRGRAVVVRRYLAPLWRRYMASAMTDTIVATESIAAADLARPGERINAEDHAQPGPGDRPDDG